MAEGLRTGFARADDGIQLYWRSMGDPSAPALVCCNGVGVSTFFWKYVAKHYRERYQVVLWDYRGHGLSGMPADVKTADLTVERSARDLAAVLDDIGIQAPVVLLGHSMGVQVILEFCKQFPDRVRALVPMFGTFGRPLDTFMDNPRSRSIFEVIHKIAMRSSRAGARLLRPLYASPIAFPIGRRTGLVDRYYANREDVDMYLEHLNHMDPRVFFGMVKQIADHDLEGFLPEIRVPTLIFAGENDLFTPLHRSRRMAECIGGSELIVLPEGSHAAIVEHPETIERRIDRFLAERVFVEQAMVVNR
jgi:pimeloyl-ACP methyl ester carboxylesterase